MKFYISILFLFVFFLIPKNAEAIYKIHQDNNNKYGIHVTDENDLKNAAALVNSSGGDWGYVTIVIQEDDRNLEKWQATFNKMRDLHLIPIVRLATTVTGDAWEKPDVEDAPEWAGFLNSLTWVTKNRYVVLFNEPNHAKEWGYGVNPGEYARVASAFATQLHDTSDDFYVLPAGLDASAPNGNGTMDEQLFIEWMIDAVPDIFKHFDGWTSHSYPNPGFRGHVSDVGRGTLRTYQWELDLLKTLGIKKKFQVFITETGWPHMEGTDILSRYFQANDVAHMIDDAATLIWSDPRIVAVTPFTLNYQGFPFSNFSWQKPGSQFFYPQYDVYRSIPKKRGSPELVIQPTRTPTPSPTKKPRVLGTTSHKPNDTHPIVLGIQYTRSAIIEGIQTILSY